MKKPWVIYADFESIVKKIHGCMPDPGQSSTNGNVDAQALRFLHAGRPLGWRNKGPIPLQGWGHRTGLSSLYTAAGKWNQRRAAEQGPPQDDKGELGRLQQCKRLSHLQQASHQRKRKGRHRGVWPRHWEVRGPCSPAHEQVLQKRLQHVHPKRRRPVVVLPIHRPEKQEAESPERRFRSGRLLFC